MKLFSRKFMVTITVVLASTIGLLLNKISADVWSSVSGGAFAAFHTANLIQSHIFKNS